MKRKTRWSTRVVIVLVMMFTLYMGWHLKKAIHIYKEETSNNQPQVLDYSENGYIIKR